MWLGVFVAAPSVWKWRSWPPKVAWAKNVMWWWTWVMVWAMVVGRRVWVWGECGCVVSVGVG